MSSSPSPHQQQEEEQFEIVQSDEECSDSSSSSLNQELDKLVWRLNEYSALDGAYRVRRCLATSTSTLVVELLHGDLKEFYLKIPFEVRHVDKAAPQITYWVEAIGSMQVRGVKGGEKRTRSLFYRNLKSELTESIVRSFRTLQMNMLRRASELARLPFKSSVRIFTEVPAFEGEGTEEPQLVIRTDDETQHHVCADIDVVARKGKVSVKFTYAIETAELFATTTLAESENESRTQLHSPITSLQHMADMMIQDIRKGLVFAAISGNDRAFAAACGLVEDEAELHPKQQTLMGKLKQHLPRLLPALECASPRMTDQNSNKLDFTLEHLGQQFSIALRLVGTAATQQQLELSTHLQGSEAATEISAHFPVAAESPPYTTLMFWCSERIQLQLHMLLRECCPFKTVTEVACMKNLLQHYTTELTVEALSPCMPGWGQVRAFNRVFRWYNNSVTDRCMVVVGSANLGREKRTFTFACKFFALGTVFAEYLESIHDVLEIAETVVRSNLLCCNEAEIQSLGGTGVTAARRLHRGVLLVIDFPPNRRIEICSNPSASICIFGDDGVEQRLQGTTEKEKELFLDWALHQLHDIGEKELAGDNEPHPPKTMSKEEFVQVLSLIGSRFLLEDKDKVWVTNMQQEQARALSDIQQETLLTLGIEVVSFDEEKSQFLFDCSARRLALETINLRYHHSSPPTQSPYASRNLLTPLATTDGDAAGDVTPVVVLKALGFQLATLYKSENNYSQCICNWTRQPPEKLSVDDDDNYSHALRDYQTHFFESPDKYADLENRKFGRLHTGCRANASDDDDVCRDFEDVCRILFASKAASLLRVSMDLYASGLVRQLVDLGFKVEMGRGSAEEEDDEVVELKVGWHLVKRRPMQSTAVTNIVWIVMELLSGGGHAAAASDSASASVVRLWSDVITHTRGGGGGGGGCLLAAISAALEAMGFVQTSNLDSKVVGVTRPFDSP